jgi:hypothetical protein
MQKNEKAEKSGKRAEKRGKSGRGGNPDHISTHAKKPKKMRILFSKRLFMIFIHLLLTCKFRNR